MLTASDCSSGSKERYIHRIKRTKKEGLISSDFIYFAFLKKTMKLDILAFGAHPDDIEISAGGMIISRSGFLLLNAKHKADVKGKTKKEAMEKEDISFSPLAMPLLAGPGSISLLINMRLEYPEPVKKVTIMLAIIGVAFSIYLIFSIAPKILKYTGNAGLKSLSKIMGFLVLAIGIEMISASILTMLKSVF